MAATFAVEHALTTGGALVGAFNLTALTRESFFAHTNSVGAVTLAITAIEAPNLRAVVTSETVLTFTFASVLTSTVPLTGTVVSTGDNLGAVEAAVTGEAGAGTFVGVAHTATAARVPSGDSRAGA